MHVSCIIFYNNDMETVDAVNEYSKALKKGRKQYRKDLWEKNNPHLLALEKIVDFERLTQRNMGIIEVPSFLIIGTIQQLRAECFSKDFMPLIKNGSEFAFKWSNVVKYHTSDSGISECPIVYEYLGNFYVKEGNKRVSVLKYYGAITIACEVVRLFPENDGGKQFRLYDEFLRYYNMSKLYSIQFHKEGYYQKLQRLVGFDENYEWDRSDRYKLIGIYERFKELCVKRKVDIYYPDGLMIMMEIYGYQYLTDMTNKEMIEAIEVNKNKLIYNKAHYNILCVSDEEDDNIWNGYHKDLKDVDFIISCGDIKASYLEYLVTVSNKELFYVHGNHDESYDMYPPEGCTCVDDDLYIYNGIRILGLGGSVNYNNSKYMYSEKEMEKRISKLSRKIKKAGGVDIVVAHSPIQGYGNLDDYAHQGFECMEHLVKKYKPKYYLFGHVHKNYDHTYSGFYKIDETQIINVVPKERIIY